MKITCISVCTKNDLYTWSFTSNNILKFIKADSYKVIVPASDIHLFKAVTPKQFEIIDEQLFASEFSLAFVKNKMPTENKNRAGWYYQQLLKIKALSMHSSHNDLNIIWDADTMPLQPISFKNNNGSLIFYKGSEYHKPYFKTIKNLTALSKINDFSFIAQSFPAYSSWVTSFLDMLEQQFNTPWYEAILEQTDLNEASGFSEYETLGTYFMHHYQDKMHFSDTSWNRVGQNIIQIEDHIYLEKLKFKPLFIGYEKYLYEHKLQSKLSSLNDNQLILYIKSRHKNDNIITKFKKSIYYSYKLKFQK